MLERIYFSLWGIFALTVAAFYLTGSLTSGMIAVFGFIMFGLIFMGMIGVLPFWTTHHTAHKH